MKIQVLGTSSGRSTPERKTSGTVVSIGNRNIVIDPSSGTLERFKEHNHKLKRVSHILVTHAHHDHFLGLFDFISEIGITNKQSLTLMIPEDLLDLVQTYMSVTEKNPKFYDFLELITFDDLCEDEILWSINDHICLEFSPLKHGKTKSFAFTIYETKPRKLRINLLKEDNIPPIEYRKYINDYKYTYKPKMNVYIHCGDNESVEHLERIVNEHTVNNSRNVLVYHEATYTNDVYERLSKEGKTHGHLSIGEITKFWERFNDTQHTLILSHFSPRNNDFETIMSNVSKDVNPNNVHIAFDGFKIDF